MVAAPRYEPPALPYPAGPPWPSVTVHGLRHTFGTRLYAATSDLRLVQAALHHRHVSTTERYTRVAESRLREAVEAVA